MKKLLLSSITILYWAATHAQIESTISVPYTTSASPTYKALLYLPTDYSTTTKNYPLLVFSHSASEAADGASTGTGLAKIYNQASYGGPAYFIEHGGWPASFTNPVNGVQEQFIVVSPQASTWSISGDQLANIVNYLVATYRVDINRIHLTGVSAGGAGVVEYAAQMDPNEDAPSLTKDVRKWKPADIVAMSEATNDATQTWGNVIVADSIPDWGFGDPNNDLYGGFAQDLTTVINKAKSGYARFTSFTTGHGPWNPFYNPTYTENFTWRTIKANYSIYSWMLGNSRIPIPIVPVANAGSAQTIALPTSMITLNGSNSTGNITSYAWTQVSGPAGDTIKTPTAVSTSITGLVQGVYVFQLTVTGGSTSTVQITVNPIPPPPVANAGVAQTITLPTSTVTLSGSGSTGTITSYSWTQVSGPSTATIATPTSVSAKVSALVQGVYVFQLALNGGSTSTVQVTVNAPTPPVANAGAPQTITLPTSQVTLSASGSTGTITSYAWKEVSGPTTATLATPTTVSTKVTGLTQAGPYIFQVTLNGVSSSTVQVTVNPQPGAANAGTAQVITLPTNKVTLNGSASTGTITSYAWTQVSGPSGDTISTPSAVSTTVTGLVQGVYVFQLTVNGSSSATVQVTVSPQPPLSANAGNAQTITLPTSKVNLSASASTGVIASFAWTQLIGPAGDTIQSPTSSTTAVTGMVAGTYTFQLKLTDNLGAVSTGTVDVLVLSTAGYASPSASIATPTQTVSLPAATANETANYTLTGTSLNSVKWTKFKVPGQTPKTVVFLGSSTTAGTGASTEDSAYVWRFTAYYTAQGMIKQVVNLGVSGYNPYNAMPTGYVAPASVVNALGASVAAVDPTVNVTKALSFNPDIIIINFPSNGYDVLSLPDIMNGLQLLYNASTANGAQCYVSTTQPREDYTASIQSFFQVLRDSILLRFGSHAMDFYDAEVVPGTTKRLYPSSADDIHLNDQGHRQLFNVVVGTNVFQNKISSASVINTPGAATTSIGGLTQGVNLFQATVVDGHGQNISAVATVTVNQGTNPVANAGPAQTITLPANRVIMNGNSSTGTVTSYSWTQVSGPAADTIVSPASDSTLVTGLVQGVYVFQLALNGGSVATVQVTVNPAPPPVANAGAPQTILLPLNKVMLNGNSSGGFITSYNWTQVSGPATDTIVSPATDSTMITGLTQGVYVFQLTLNGDSAATVQVTVNPPPPPIANAGPAQTINLPNNTVLLAGNASGGYITSYAWTQTSGPITDTIVSPATDSTMITGLTQGVYVFQLMLNGDSTATVQVTVNPPPPPIANAGPAQTIALPNNKVMLNGNASGGTITSYNWTQVSGPATDTIVSPATDSTMITGLTQGVYVFQLMLNGDSTATVQVTVNPPPPPIANAGPAQTITLPNNKIMLNGNASGGTITSYNWTQVSGPATDTIVSPATDSTMITGLTQGIYVFQLMLNGDSTATVQVTVNPPPPPIANAGSSQTITEPVNRVTLSGSASGGYITSYAWTQVSGPATDTIGSPSSVGTAVTGLTPGVYVFLLTLNGDSSATVQVTVNQPPVVANAGVSQSITLPANQVTLNGGSSGGLLTSYKWTETSGPVSDTIVSPSAVTTVVRGLVQGVYIFQLAVTDNLGTVKVDTMTVTVVNGVVSKQINVNVYGGTSAYSNTQWNNWNVNNGVNSPTLTYSDGTSSGATASLSINESVVDNGTTYGGTMAPPEVLRFTSYCETTRTLTLNTLKTGSTYNIELYASRNSNSGQKSVFAISGLVSDTILSFNNLTSKAVFSGVKASSGKIVITISTPTGYNYLNGFAITELTSSTGTTSGGESDPLSAYAASFGVGDSVTTGLSGVQIYPNPARDQFTLNLDNEHTGAMRITIVNAGGVALRALESRKEGQISSTNIPVSGLAAGTYFILVQVGDWRESRTLLKL